MLGVGAALGLLRTLAVVAWCWALAQAITAVALPALGGSGAGSGRIGEGAAGTHDLPALVGLAVLAALARAGAGWAMDVLAARGAVRAKAQLRASALDAVDARSPEQRTASGDAASAMVLGRGLDALDGYFSQYLPQLILSACATPILVLAVLLADPVSGITVLIVFPVIPLFMVLIGLATQAVQQRQWSQLERLSRSFLDAVEGLTTLKIYRREHRQSARIERETEEYRSRTMGLLRVTFLSGFVLDLAGTFSIALVAVTVGTRLVAGEFPLAAGLFVLLLLPEVFIPIRQVGAAFHASTEGVAAAREAFALIEGGARNADGGQETGASTASPTPVEGGRGIRLDRVCVVRPGGPLVGPVSFDVEAGRVVALTGPSGAGKSTLIAALLGFVEPRSGTLERPGVLAWAGQRPGLLQGTLAWNIALGSGDPERPLVLRALDCVGLADLDPDRRLGALGAGLSGGQAQRVAIARCLYRAWRLDAAAVVLDEPSSALDRRSEARIAAALRAEADAGRAVLVVSHRSALIAGADSVVRLGGAS